MHQNLLLPLKMPIDVMCFSSDSSPRPAPSLSKPRELHESFSVRPLVSDLILGLGAQEGLARHGPAVDAVVCDRVDDEVGGGFVAWWRHVVVVVLSRAWVCQVDATLLLNRQRFDARVAR